MGFVNRVTENMIGSSRRIVSKESTYSFSINRFLLYLNFIVAILHTFQGLMFGIDDTRVKRKPFNNCINSTQAKNFPEYNIVHSNELFFVALIWVVFAINLIHSIHEWIEFRRKDSRHAQWRWFGAFLAPLDRLLRPEVDTHENNENEQEEQDFENGEENQNLQNEPHTASLPMLPISTVDSNV